MTISVVIPTYNRANLLRRALNSLAKQTLKPDQIIISDNASDDNTLDIVNEFINEGFKVNYYKHKTNLGMLKNWQHAISMVDTSHFLVLADDDYLLPNCLAVGMSILNSDSNIGLFCGVTVCLNSKLEPISTAPSNLDAIGKRDGFNLLTYMLQHPGSTGSIISKKHFDQAGGFREQSGYLADLSIILRVAAFSRAIFVTDPVAIYSASETYSKGHLFNSWYPGCLDIFEQLQQLGMKNKFAYKRYVARTLYLSFAHLIKNILNKDKTIKDNYKIFTGLFKYLTPTIVCLSLLEGLRLNLYKIRNKYRKAVFVEYCNSHNILQKIAEANV